MNGGWFEEQQRKIAKERETAAGLLIVAFIVIAAIGALSIAMKLYLSSNGAFTVVVF